MSENNKIGEKVRSIRESRKLAVGELSERTQLPVAEIESIEKGQMIPSLTPLIKIARVLGVRLGTFMDDLENIGPVVSRKDQHAQAVRFSGNAQSKNSDLDFFSLAADKSGRHMEPFLIDIHPSSRDEAQLSSHEGEEFIFVLSGKVEILYGKDKFELNEGDNIYYDSVVAHHVQSAGGQPAKILAVVYAPY